MQRLALILLTFLLLSGTSAVQATVLTYRAHLEGLNEDPPNESRAHGSTVIVIDDVAHTMYVGIGWAGIVTRTTAAHLHCCTAGPFSGIAPPATMVPSFPGFPTDATFDGFYERDFSLLDPSTYNPAFLNASGGTAEGAEAALLAGLASGRSYLNIHSEQYPAGEIRGFLRPPQSGGTIPEPGGIALFGVGTAALAWRNLAGRRRLAWRGKH